MNNTPRNVLNSKCLISQSQSSSGYKTVLYLVENVINFSCYLSWYLTPSIPRMLHNNLSSFYLELLCHNTYSNLSCHSTYTSNLSVMIPNSLSVILPGNLCVMFPSNLPVIITNMQALCHFAKQLLFFSWPLNFSSQTALCLFICSIAIFFSCHL